MQKPFVLAGAALAVLSATCAAASDPKVIVGAAVGASTSIVPTEPNEPNVLSGLGGTAFNSFFSVDVHLTRILRIGAEASLGGDLTGLQENHYLFLNYSLMSQHHDNVFCGVLKVDLPLGRRVTLTPVAGAGFTDRQTTATGTLTALGFSPGPVSVTASGRDLALTGGIDFSCSLNPHFAILALARVDHLGQGQGFFAGSISPWAVVYGVGAQVRF